MIIKASTRRGFAAALLGISLLGGYGPLLRPLRAAPTLPLRLPDQPLRLQRVLERGLGEGGAPAIVVRRWWEVVFERQTRGIIVNGRQLGSEVTAPPALAELARIEEQRDASGMFPLMLAEDGTIITAPSALPESDALAAAMRAAEGLIARQTLPAEERARIRHYLAEVHRAGTGLLDTLPGDLLFPTGVPIDRAETVTLPDGLTGHFALTYFALRQPDAPWLIRAERKVVTRIGATRRTATETWTLTPP